jgi:hypothetical protein
MKVQKGFLAAAAVLLLLMGMVTPADLQAIDEVTILLGTVSSKGLITTDKGESYMLAPGPLREELIKDDGKKVIVTGVVGEGGGGIPVLSVNDYQFVEEGGPPKGEE